MVSKAWPIDLRDPSQTRARSSMVEQFPFKEAVERSNRSGLTNLGITLPECDAWSLFPLSFLFLNIVYLVNEG